MRPLPIVSIGFVLAAATSSADAQTPWGGQPPAQPPPGPPAQQPTAAPAPSELAPQALAPMEVQTAPPPGWVAMPGRVRPTIPRRRVDLGLEVVDVHATGSAYNREISGWGYSGFSEMPQVSVRATFPLLSWFQIGPRLGYTYADGGTAMFDGARLSANLFDIDVVARLIYEWARLSGVTGRIGVDLQGGLAIANLNLRSQNSGAAMARVAGEFFVGIAPSVRGPSFVFHLGYQYVPYGGAGLGSTDPVFAGAIVGLAVELPL